MWHPCITDVDLNCLPDVVPPDLAVLEAPYLAEMHPCLVGRPQALVVAETVEPDDSVSA